MAAKRIKDTPFMRRARERFKLADTADEKQARREKEDLAFYAGDQWPADIMLARQGQQPTNGMPAVPSRPTLVINKVREPVRQVQNEIRDSDIGIELTPADDFGDLGVTPDDSEVTLREGLVRRIIRDSNGQDAWNWAGDRADIAGRGYFAVMTRYLPGKTNDQEIYLMRIFNQAGVLGDPSRTEPDGSDADWWFVGKWMLWDRFVAEYPEDADGKNNPLCAYSEADFTSMVEDYPSWYKLDGSGEDKTRSIRIVDYWYTERTHKELVTLENGKTFWADELPEDAGPEADRRMVVQPSIKFCKIGGGVIELEKTDWAGPDMPIIEILGEEMHPYDDQRRVEGMVRNARDSQMAFNYMVSKQVEQIGLSPIPPLMLDPDAIEGYEDFYKVANTRALPYLPYRTRGDGAQEPFNPPHRPPVDPGNLAIAQSIALFDQMIKSTTAVPDPTLGNVDPTLKSGRAIKETVLNAKASTSNFVHGRVKGIRRAACVINNLLFPIYGNRPGRLVRIMTGEGEPEAMAIGQQPPPQQMQTAQQAQKVAQVAKLTEDAKFNIAVKITKNYDTQRQQQQSMLGDLISAEPTLMTWYGDIFLNSSDIPGRKQLAERTKVMLAPPIQQMLAEKEQGGEPLPPAAQAKIAQMQEQLQHAEAAIKELAPKAEGNQLDADTKMRVATLSAQKDLELKKMDFEQAITLQQMKDAVELRKAELAAMQNQHALEHEADAMHRSQAHEAQLQASSQQHEQQATAAGQQHDMAMTGATLDGEADEAERGRQAASDEAERSRQASSDEAMAQRAFDAEQAAQAATQPEAGA